MLKYLMSVIFKRQCKTVSHRDFQMKIIFSFKAEAPQMHVLTGEKPWTGDDFSCCKRRKNCLERRGVGAEPREGTGQQVASFLQNCTFKKKFLWSRLFNNALTVLFLVLHTKAYLKITLRFWPQTTNSRKFSVRVETLSVLNLPLGPRYYSIFGS